MDSDCEGSRAPGLISFNNFSAFLHPGFSFCMFHFIRGQLQCWYFDIFNLVQNWNCEIPRKFQSLSRLPGALLSTLHFCSINFCATSCCEHKNQNLNNHSKTLQARQHLRTHDATSRSHSTFSFQVTQPLLKWQKPFIMSLNLFLSHATSPNIQSNFKILYNIMPICLSRYVRPISVSVTFHSPAHQLWRAFSDPPVMRDRLISRWVNGVHIRQMFKCSAQMLRLQTGLYCKLDGAKPQSILYSQISRELGVYTKNTINSFLQKWKQLKGDEGISNLNH